MSGKAGWVAIKKVRFGGSGVSFGEFRLLPELIFANLALLPSGQKQFG